MNRPKWKPRDDQDRADLARMDVLAEQLAASEAALLKHASHMLQRRIPGEEVARRARLSKATLYRKVGPNGSATNG